MNIEDKACVHMFPDDLEEMSERETGMHAYSVPCGHPDKRDTVPLFTIKQIIEILKELDTSS